MGAAAMPVAMGASALGSSLIGSYAAKQASKLSPEETRLIGSQTALADQSRQQGADLFSQAMPWYRQAGGYYSALLGGDRAKMSHATAGTRESIADQYSGAIRGLERSGMRGGARDLAYGNLVRQQAGDTSRVTAGVQPGAAAALTGMAGQGLGAGQGSVGTASNIYGSLLQNATGNRMVGNQVGTQVGGDVGGLIYQMLKQGSGGSKKGATNSNSVWGTGLPS